VYAAIDVGTHTVRLLLVEVGAGKIVSVRYYRKITRLGGGFTADKGLAPEAMERTLLSLLEVSTILRDERISKARSVGTAALRDALNGPEFIARVRSETGLRIEIIDGEEEARLCARGVLAALEPCPQRCLIFDIGGGSTEFLLQAERGTLFHRSYPLGVVTLSEKFGTPESQQNRIRQVLDSFYRDLADSGYLQMVHSGDVVLVGTAGTVTTLAALHLGMTDYDWRRVNNLSLDHPTLDSLRFRLEALSPIEREVLPGMEKGRGDLIVPGLHIVLEIMARLGKNCLIVSDFGLLEGVALALAEATP
jgi:exopolyphosphatase/guanosine-5'-triphosphate,3'-diphosphate pyrophosphatase